MYCDELIVEAEDRAQVKELKRQILSLKAQLDQQKVRSLSLRGGNLLKSEAIDFYPGEQHDFILSILEQVKPRCPENSRPRDIIESILALNKPIGRGYEILNELNRVFKNGEPTTQADIAALESIGFTYTKSRKHPKLRFHDKYMFVLSATPGDDKRGAKNKLAQINKCIAVSQSV